MKRIQIFLLILLTFSQTACGVYSFTGASIPAGAKSVSIRYFPNNAMLVEPTLSIVFTTAMRDKFMSQTNLNMIDNNGDLAFEGEIIDFKTTPVAIQSDQTAALNRLTITINVRFYNKLDPAKEFENKFTQYLDYPSDQDFNSVKSTLIPTIVEMLVEDIFNKAVVNW
jgi:hypothetical protein